MVANSEKERKRFTEALNARVARDHPAMRGRPQWLHRKLKEYRNRTGRNAEVVSVQTCAYWLSGAKIARVEHASLLCGALGLTRGELYGDSVDPLLSALVDQWVDIPDNIKMAISALITRNEDVPLAALKKRATG